MKKKIAKVFKFQQLDQGEILFSKGDGGDCAYMILEGRVGIYSNTASRQFRKEIGTILKKDATGLAWDQTSPGMTPIPSFEALGEPTDNIEIPKPLDQLTLTPEKSDLTPTPCKTLKENLTLLTPTSRPNNWWRSKIVLPKRDKYRN